MKTLVITDDNAGFTYKEAEELGIKITRMPIIIDGNVYFDTTKYDKYYELSGRNADDLMVAVREEIKEQERKEEQPKKENKKKDKREKEDDEGEEPDGSEA